MREVREAERLQRPLVLVEELDKKKGGDDLDNLKDTCHDAGGVTLLDYVFDHDVIAWSRLQPYQLQACLVMPA